MSMHSIIFPKNTPGAQWTSLGLEIKLRQQKRIFLCFDQGSWDFWACSYFGWGKTRGIICGNHQKCHPARLFLWCSHAHRSGSVKINNTRANIVITEKHSIILPSYTLFYLLTLTWQGHTDELWGLDVHPSTEQFVTCGQDKQVHLWDVASHEPLWSKTIEVFICFILTKIYSVNLMEIYSTSMFVLE